MNIKKQISIFASAVFALSVFVSPVSAACTLQTLGECDQAGLMSLISGLSTTTTTTTTTTPVATIGSIPTGFTFTKNLTLGSRGEDVKYLQVFLNADPETKVSVSGAGSAGNETTYFGNATKAAVKKFQTKYGITPVAGYFGVISRTKANQLLATTTPVTPVTPGDTTGCAAGAAYSATTGLPCGTTTTPTNPTVPVTGSLSVAIASDNPAVSTFISCGTVGCTNSQAIADMAHYTFTNGSNAEAKITAIELTRLGVSADGTLKNVYLFNGTTRLTDAGSLSSGKVTFNDPNGIFTIPAGSTVTISVKADIGNNYNGQTVGLSLSGVTTSVTLVANLPLNGNIHSIANATLAQVVVGTPQPNANVAIDPASGTRIWESAFTINNRNVKFTRLSLKQINSIDAKDLANFKLLIDGTEVATVASLVNNYAVFTFDKILATGTRNVKVLADINGGSSRIIQMSLRNNADIDIRDVDYNVSVSPTVIPATTGQMTVNQGTTTVSADNAALPATVANNASGILLGKWKVKANGENIRVEGLRFTGVGGGTGAGSISSLKNGKVMINGSQYGSTAGLALTAGTLYNVNYTFQTGVETIVEFYADIAEDTTGATVSADTTNNIANGSTITITFAVPTSANGTKQVSLGTVNVPTTASPAAGLSVADGTSGFTVIKTTNFTNQNVTFPKNAFKVGSYQVTAGTSEDIYVNNFRLAIAAVGGTTVDFDDFADMYVTYSNDGAAAITTSPRATPTASNDFPVSFTLARGKTVTVDVYATLRDGVDAGAVPAIPAITPGESAKTTLIVSGTGASSGVGIANTATSGQVVIAQNAVLAVSRDASTPVTALADDSGTIKSVAYKFEAQNDSYSISRVVFTISDPTVVSAVNLKDGDTILASQPGASTVTFNLGTPFTVPANSPKVLTVEMSLAGVGLGLGNSGANVKTNIVFASCLARSTNGTLGAPTTDNTVPGNSLYVYKAIPTISLVSLPTSTLATGTQTLSKFTINTNGTGSISWRQIIFAIAKNVSAADADGLSPTVATAQLWDADSGIQVATVGCTIASVGGHADMKEADATGTITCLSTGEEQISGGKTYELRATIGGSVPASSYVNTRITTSATNYYIGKNGGASHYSDVDGSATVTAGDVRVDAVTSIASAYTQTNTGVVTFDTADGTDEVMSYGTVTNGSTIVLTETGIATNVIGAITGTLISTDGFTCAAYDAANGTGNTTTTIASIQSIKCTNSTVLGQVILNVDPLAADAAAANTSIALTSGTYAAGTTVAGAGADSDTNAVIGTSALTTATVPATSAFIWSDQSAQGHNATSTTDWTSEFLVKTLPTSTQNLSK
ncbi:MAG: peptidoglycan-binding domain-containing protein [Candidatus Paceibacterota bacterium]